MSQTPVPQARQLARLGDDAALLHAPQHPDCTLRSRLESFVHDCFADTYGANVRQFMPELLGLCQQGALQAGGAAPSRPSSHASPAAMSRRSS